MKESKEYVEVAELIGKFLKEELTAAESERLKTWIEEDDKHLDLWQRLTDPVYLEDHVRFWEDKEDKDLYWKQLADEIFHKRPQKRIIFRKVLRYAAVVLPFILFLGAGFYFFNHRRGKSNEEQSQILAGIHVMPRGKVAQLVLANGKVFNLSDSVQEAITEKDGTKVRNQASALSYATGSKNRRAATLYNMLVTPRGGEYQVKLSDGTKVWLNAASSLRYPTQFNGEERKVFLSGEAYFEVAKDAAHPFIVNAGNTDIRVLGTKFNVSSYPDDPRQKTTLAEGSVRVSKTGQLATGHKGVLLKPGYEAVINKNGNNIQIEKADVEAALGWKNGMFIFDSESLGSLLRKLSRWYNVDVAYAEGVDTLFHFTGRIERYENIAGILHLIELTGKVQFTLTDHELYVRPDQLVSN
jgi:ferric-dicitrate binding protein FerR (iron transport regulator)